MTFEIGKVTKEMIRTSSAADLMVAYRNPQLKEEIERVANTVEPTPEEIQAALDAQTAQQVAAEQARLEAEAKASELAGAAQAEAARAVEAARVAVEEAQAAEAAKKKIVLDYQVTDEQGAPIGRPTHIEAWSMEELIEKQKKAHIEATRYAHRLKTKREAATYKPAEPVRMTDAQIAAVAAELDSEDESTVKAARKKIEDDAKLVAEKSVVNQDAIDRENLRQSIVAVAFIRNHIHDYNQCKANGQILSDYLRENNLEWTENNLELAFTETASQLVPVPVRESASTTQPVPAVNPVAQVPTVAPAATVEAQPAAPPAIPAGVAPPRAPGGIEPGVTLTGRQPVSQAPKLTKADVRKWTPQEMRKQLKDPKILAEFNLLFPQK